MAATAAISSQGTIILLGGASVAEITGWSGFGSEAEMVEATSIDSDDDRDEWIKVLLRSGDITLDMKYTADTYAQIEVLVNSFTKTTFSIQTRTPDDKIYSCACDVTSNKQNGSSGDLISASVGVKLSGEITVTDA